MTKYILLLFFVGMCLACCTPAVYDTTDKHGRNTASPLPDRDEAPKRKFKRVKETTYAAKGLRNFDTLIEYCHSRDTKAIDRMKDEGKVFIIEPGTLVEVQIAGLEETKVKILDGPQKGWELFIASLTLEDMP